MERCDFSTVTNIIRKNISEDLYSDQIDFLYSLFQSFLSEEENRTYGLDQGLVCRWFSGQKKVSGKIVNYYLEHKDRLTNDIKDKIVPNLYDRYAAIDSLYELVTQDTTISAAQRQELIANYPDDVTGFVSDVLAFSMAREFIKRDANFKKRLKSGEVSPVTSDYIFGCNVPRPCNYFCGRDEELEQIHLLLQENGKVFLNGIAGIGKSELSKAYARKYRKDYTNIIFITYSGNLHNDIANIDFADDFPDEDPKKRYHRHHSFFKTLKEDTLLIIDNFNTTASDEEMLSKVLNRYRCRILFTTRNRWDENTSLELCELNNIDDLFMLVKSFFKEADRYQDTVLEMIELVHRHTFAVELISRLLAHGILSPNELLIKLQQEKAALSSTDVIESVKDGNSRRQTYRDHIRLLFSLFNLTDDAQSIMRNMVFAPASGISARLFASWLRLENMNVVNDLIASGFIKETAGYSISLHPLTKEVAISDLDPTISNCRILFDTVNELCLHHGESLPYYRALFQVIENINDHIGIDDMPAFLLLLGNAIMYMDTYNYASGIHNLTHRLSGLLEHEEIGTNKDRAVLLICQAIPDKYSWKTLSLYKKALELVPDLSGDNAALISNIHCNMATIYQSKNNLKAAADHLKTAVSILERYDLLSSHDGFVQYINFGKLLYKSGDIASALSIAKRAAQLIEENGDVLSADSALVQADLGIEYLSLMRFNEGVFHLNTAIKIISTIWSDDPDIRDTKIHEIVNAYNQFKTLLKQKRIPDSTIRRLPALTIPD